jgi:hypothetical protein
MHEQKSTAESPLPIKPALRRYWAHLSGVIAFPMVVGVFNEFADLSIEYVAILFFCVMVPPVWLVLAGRARYSFWLATLAIYMLSAIPASIAVQVVRVLHG